MIMLAVISRINSACTRRVLRAWAATANDRFWPVDLPETTFRYGSDPDLRAARLNACSTRQADVYLAGVCEAAASDFRRGPSTRHLGGAIESEMAAGLNPKPWRFWSGIRKQGCTRAGSRE